MSKQLAYRLMYAALFVGPLAAQPADATGVPVDGFLPQVGFTLTNEYVDDFDFFPKPEFGPGGVFLGDPTGYYEVALLDTGAAVSLITTAADEAFKIDQRYPGDGERDGFRGTEPITIGGASGFLEASIGDPLGLYADGLQNRTASGASLKISPTSMPGQSNTSIITIPTESDLPNVIGLPFASQYATRIRSSLPQVFELNGETVRSPAIDFQPLGSQGLGITRKAQLNLLGSSPSTPLHVVNLGNFNIDHPNEDPSQPTVVQGGHFLNATFNNDGANLSSSFFFDTGASVTVLSQFKALEMGFDVTLDTPEFTISIIGSGGQISDVPGFFVDQLTIPALGGSLVVNNVPVIVLDVTNVSNPGNVVDGIIGTNIFQGRDIVIDPNPSLGGGGPSAGVYISDPVTTDYNWTGTTATGDWTTNGNWSAGAATTYTGIVNARHVSGGNQTINMTGDQQAFEINISGGTAGETMTVSMATGSKLTTFSGTNLEAGGILSMTDATLDTQYVDIRTGGTLTGSGIIRTGSGEIAGQVENVGGTFAPGSPLVNGGIGTLEIEGRFANARLATSQFQLAGTTAGTEHDQLSVEGGAAVAGTLEVTLDAAYTPTANSSYTLITTSEGIGGTFETLVLPTEYQWEALYGQNDLELKLIGLTGDFNGDNTVDTADYTMWRDGLGTTYVQADYELWKANYGNILLAGSSAAAAAAVPEPASLLTSLLATAFGLMMGGRKHRR